MPYTLKYYKKNFARYFSKDKQLKDYMIVWKKIFFPFAEKCDAGQTWSYLRWKCVRCEEGFYKAEDGNHNCTACPKYYNPYSDQTGCGDSKFSHKARA